MRMAYENDRLEQQFRQMQMQELPKQAEFERRLAVSKLALEQQQFAATQAKDRATALRDQILAIERSADPVYEAAALGMALGTDMGIREGTPPEQVRSQAAVFRRRIESMAGLAPEEVSYGEVTRKEGDVFRTYQTEDGRAVGAPIAEAPRYKEGGVTVALPEGEKAYDKELGKYYSGVFGKTQDIGREATNTMATASRLRQLQATAMRPGPVTTAIGAPLAAIANNFGVDIKGLGATQAYTAIINELSLRMRNPESGFGMPGAISKFDLEFLRATTPSNVNSLEAQTLIIERMEKIAEHQKKVAAFARQYAKDHQGRLDMGYDDALAEWVEKNPIFSPDDRDKSVPEGTRRRAKGTDRVEVFKGGKWQPLTP